MPHIVKISQRRKGSGLVPEQVIYRFRHERKSGRHASDSVDGMRRNGWTACVGLRKLEKTATDLQEITTKMDKFTWGKTKELT